MRNMYEGSHYIVASDSVHVGSPWYLKKWIQLIHLKWIQLDFSANCTTILKSFFTYFDPSISLSLFLFFYFLFLFLSFFFSASCLHAVVSFPFFSLYFSIWSKIKSVTRGAKAGKSGKMSSQYWSVSRLLGIRLQRHLPPKGTKLSFQTLSPSRRFFF